MYQGKCRVIANEEVMPSVQLLEVAAPEIAACAFPGQFVMLSCDSGNERLLRRPISIYRVQAETVSFLFAVLGKGTEWLAGLKGGDSADLLGPMGKGFTLDGGTGSILLVAGGMGIAPLCFLAEKALSQGKEVKLLAGAKTAALVCPERFIPKGVELVIATEDGSAGAKGMITSLIPQSLGQAERVYICGPLPMYQAIRKSYSDLLCKLPVEVSLEVRMGCGLGFCYACTIKTRQGLKQVCKDGPVFRMEDLETGLLFEK
jgi:dihydroorotate dehydrogenase electron transfer subunit